MLPAQVELPFIQAVPYVTPILNSTTTYYVSIYEVATPACESSRTPVTVTVLATPTYTTATNLTKLFAKEHNTSFINSCNWYVFKLSMAG